MALYKFRIIIIIIIDILRQGLLFYWILHFCCNYWCKLCVHPVHAKKYAYCCLHC